MAGRKVILDTDPGIDDILALLLSLTSSPDELDLLLISITHGNIEVEHCLRNIITLFAVLGKEADWRNSKGLPYPFKLLERCKPLIAVGADKPMYLDELNLDYYFGNDGIANLHTTHPHYTPEEYWTGLFNNAKEHPEDVLSNALNSANFTPSKVPAHKEILRILKEEPENTVTLIAVGPLTNFAMAFEEDPETFIRAKEIVIMGGALSVPGNVTSVAEFNIWADPYAAAKVLALSSKDAVKTWPLVPKGHEPLKQNPAHPINITVFPLDVTLLHSVSKPEVEAMLQPYIASGSPLAEWMSAFLTSLMGMIAAHAGLKPHDRHDAIELELHDPLVAWYVMMNAELAGEEGGSGHGGWTIEKDVDVRVETQGHLTKGMCVVDKREEAVRNKGEGNRVRVCTGTGWEETFAGELVRRIFDGIPVPEGQFEDAE